MITRRQALAAAATPLGLSACAVSPRSPAARVLVVGGGFGGATAAHYLKRWGGDAVDVTLVEREAQFVSCPMSNRVIAGLADVASLQHSYAGLEALGVRRVQAEVLGLDPVARRLDLQGRAPLTWDRLVLAPGIGFMTDTVPGLQAAFDRGQAVHAWRAGPQTLALRRQLQALPDGGVVLMSIPKAPYRCPPGPYERACLVADYLRRAKPRAKLLVLDANPEIQSKKALFERAFAQHHTGVLEYRPNAELLELRPDGTARFEFEDVKADVLNLIPPQRAGDLALPLANMNRRWVGVDWLTLEAQAAPGVHVVGDALFAAPGMPKSAHLANQQAKVAAAAVLALLTGEPVNPAPVVMNTCYSFVTADLAAHVASVHQYDPPGRTLRAVPGAGGVSAAASAAEADIARGWAENIWADTLALR
ncbi:FCSD flavin-binding domain-containing protein [Roseateles sp. BYS87W]|uniref:FCSD flavin-binding domain-containing protein n=1 Tax=Pelomonas baiyunensis TaxID=3299026 RepID=A0ABW7H0M7_9BURK